MPQIVGFVQVAPHAGAVDRSRGGRAPERRTGRRRNLVGRQLAIDFDTLCMHGGGRRQHQEP